MTCACRAAATVGVIEHGCSDAAHHLRAEDIPGERPAQPPGPWERARRTARRGAATATATHRAADPVGCRHGARRARRNSSRRRTHLLLQRRRRKEAVPAADTHVCANRLYSGADQPRLRRSADILLAVHPGAIARAQVDWSAAQVGAVVRANHANGCGTVVRGAPARPDGLAPAQTIGLPRIPRVLRRWARRLRARPEPSAVLGMSYVVHAAPVRMPLARHGAPHVPLGLRLVKVAPLSAGGRRRAGQGEMYGAAGRPRRAGNARVGASRHQTAQPALEKKTGMSIFKHLSHTVHAVVFKVFSSLYGLIPTDIRYL